MPHIRWILLYLFIMSTTILQARMVDAIALIVNGQPVTTREITSIQQRLGVSRQKAIDLLIQDRLQKAAMQDIVVSDEQVDEEIKKIAELNRLTVPKLQQILKSQGTSWSTYRNSIKTMLKQRLFFRQKVAKTIPQPTEEELKRYYTAHKNEFLIPTSIRVIEYSASSEEALKNRKKAKQQAKTLDTAKLSPSLLEILMNTPDGELTPPVNAGDRYVTYKVLSKKGRTPMPFEKAKDAVAAQWMAAQKERALKDYFKKMKTEAHIHYLRK